jgi:hypothetical protein
MPRVAGDEDRHAQQQDEHGQRHEQDNQEILAARSCPDFRLAFHARDRLVVFEMTAGLSVYAVTVRTGFEPHSPYQAM